MAKDAGDSLKHAKAIALGATPLKYRDRLSKGDEDIYRLRLRQRSSFRSAIDRLQHNADLELIQDRNRNGQVDLGEVVASSRAAGRQSDSIQIGGLAAGTYFLRVFPKSDSNTSYRLFLSAKPTQKISAAYDIVLRTNAVREASDLPPLAVNTQLTNAAQAYARSLAIDDNWSHTGADGSSPWERMRAAGYDFSEAAENLAAGHATAKSAIDGWLKSPGHRRNLLAYQVQEIGVGYFYLRNDPGDITFNHYWAQSLGTPADVKVTPNVPEDKSRIANS
jgi:uncharacterized protein YkwD